MYVDVRRPIGIGESLGRMICRFVILNATRASPTVLMFESFCNPPPTSLGTPLMSDGLLKKSDTPLLDPRHGSWILAEQLPPPRGPSKRQNFLRCAAILH